MHPPTALLLAGLWAGCAPRTPTPPAVQATAAKHTKRGAAFHFCGWPFSQGEADLDALAGRLSWYYNWSSRPLDCPDGHGVADAPALTDGRVEFVPMAWGLANDGADCEAGGACFLVDERTGGARCAAVCAAEDWSFRADGDCYGCYHSAISRADFLADVPPGSRFLLGFNEPNFKEQANLTPEAAARGWRHVQWVADQRGLQLVGPATNFCDPTPGAHHPGACIEAVNGDAMLGLAWLERFYDACTTTGAAGFDCRIDHQAIHAYSCGGAEWMIDRMKAKAGLLPSPEPHCSNGVRDADEFGVDCGGNACTACSDHARALFARPVWLTEFGTPREDCGTDDPAVLIARTTEVLRRELPRFDADPYIHRYAWFMPKVDMDSLDHCDLLLEDAAGTPTPLGELYLGGP